MYAKNCTMQDLEKALLVINEKYERNVCFRRMEMRGKRVLFTLKVKDSRKKGHRRGYYLYNGQDRRYIPCACWHVHGDFFDALFQINPDAVILSGKQRIDKYRGNWEDRNIGSQMYPYMFSEACDCESDFAESVAISN